MKKKYQSSPAWAPTMLIVIAAGALLGSCRNNATIAPLYDKGRNATDEELADPRNFDDSMAIRAQQAHLQKVELTVRAPVLKLLPTDREGYGHERFLLRLSNDTTILVTNDLTFGQAIPINAGDIPVVHGEYIWNDRGGLIHWTHHADRGQHEGGWIFLNGRRYQ